MKGCPAQPSIVDRSLAKEGLELAPVNRIRIAVTIKVGASAMSFDRAAVGTGDALQESGVVIQRDDEVDGTITDELTDVFAELPGPLGANKIPRIPATTLIHSTNRFFARRDAASRRAFADAAIVFAVRAQSGAIRDRPISALAVPIGLAAEWIVLANCLFTGWIVATG